jgi:hypothetical protein
MSEIRMGYHRSNNLSHRRLSIEPACLRHFGCQGKKDILLGGQLLAPSENLLSKIPETACSTALLGLWLL